MTNRACLPPLLALSLALLLHACGGAQDDAFASDDLEAAKAKKCTTNANCSGGQVCLSGVCKACTATSQCSAGSVCTSGACVPSTDGTGVDGAPTRTAACTPLSQETGTAINTTHGRLDGFVSYVVPLGGSRSCNGDSTHIHVQVRANGSIYDVAVDVGNAPGDSLLYEADLPLPDGAWSEGWHGSDGLSYKALGLKSTQFTSQVPATLAAKLQAELASANHISVFGTGYSSKNGCHDIHYYNGNDGALVLNPLSATPHLLFFRFSTQSF